MSRELTRCQRIEQSILKTYRKELWKPFTHAIRRYQLICPRGQDRRVHLRGKGLHAHGQADAAAAAVQRLSL